MPSREEDSNENQKRFERIWDLHHRSVARFAARRIPGDDEIADVVSDTFLAAWRHIETLEPETSRPWLLATARRQLANRLRGRRRRVVLAQAIAASAPHPNSLEDAEQGDTRDSLAAAFNALAPHDREAIALVTWEELTPTEAAQVLRIPATRFRVRLHRAKQRLKQGAQRAEEGVTVTSPDHPQPAEGIQ